MAADEYAAYADLYDLDHAQRDEDLLMLEQFCTRCGSPILELGCGSGRVLVPLAHAGFRLTGVDASPAMLDRARRRLAAEGLAERVTLVEQDMRALALGRHFRMAFVAINTFMHLLSTADQLQALAGIRQHLEPGGLLVLDLFNPDLNLLLEPAGQVVLDKVLLDPETGRRVCKFRTQTVDLARQIIHVTFVLDQVDAEGNVHRRFFSFDARFLFRAELELLLRHAGFLVESVYGSYDLDEFSGDSTRLIAVARRPD